MSIEQLGYIAPPPLPMNVTGQMDLTQAMTGPMDNGTAATRGYVVVPSGMPFFSNASQVLVPPPLAGAMPVSAVICWCHTIPVPMNVDANCLCSHGSLWCIDRQ